jgi:LmbE family N-acetylglucosaminyl deacetylase
MNCEPTHMLVFSAHPADPDFGVAGKVIHLARQKKSTVYVICTNGDKGSSDPNMKPEVLANIRKQEQLAAADLIGVREVIFLDHPDQGLEEVPSFRKEILRLILMYRPEIVVTHDPYYQPYWSNRDHRVVSRVVLDSIWPTALAPNNYPDLLAEGLQVHKVKQVMFWQAPTPNYKNDISDVWDIKIKACRIHQSQIGPQGNPEFDPMLAEISRGYAKGTNYEYGEDFNRIDVLQRL